MGIINNQGGFLVFMLLEAQINILFEYKKPNHAVFLNDVVILMVKLSKVLVSTVLYFRNRTKRPYIELVLRDCL